MALQTNTAEGQANTTAVATDGSNTGGGSGDAFSAATSGITFSSTVAAHGSMSYRMPGTASTFDVLTFSGTGDVAGFSATAYLYITAAPSAETSLVTVQTAAGGSVAGLNITATRTLKLVRTGGSLVATFTSAIPLNTWIRVAIYGTIHASTASLTAKIYTGDGTTPIETQTTAATNTGSTAAGKVLWGKLTQAPSLLVYYWDTIQQDLASPTEIGAYAPPPTLTVGEDQTVEALTTVTLTASGAASASWSQVSGPTVTVTPTGALTATFTAPASLTGAVVVARATAASATADTTVTALPHGDWSWTGTAWRGFTIR